LNKDRGTGAFFFPKGHADGLRASAVVLQSVSQSVMFQLEQMQREKGAALSTLLRIRLPRGRHTFGRTEGSVSICLPLKAVSKEHGYFAYDGARLVVYDSKSKFGTMVNGSEIAKETEVELKESDKVRIGDPYGKADFRVAKVPLRICVEDESAAELAASLGGQVVSKGRWTEPPTHCVVAAQRGEQGKKKKKTPLLLSANALRCVLRDAAVVTKSWLEASAKAKLEAGLAPVVDHAPDDAPTPADLRRAGTAALRGTAVVFPEPVGDDDDQEDDDDLEVLISELSPASAVRARVDLMDDPKKSLGSEISRVVALDDSLLGDDLVPSDLSRTALLKAVLGGTELPAVAIDDYLEAKRAARNAEEKETKKKKNKRKRTDDQDDDHQEDDHQEVDDQEEDDDDTCVSDEESVRVPPPAKNVALSSPAPTTEWISARRPTKNEEAPDSTKKLKGDMDELRRTLREEDKFDLPAEPAATVTADDLIVVRDPAPGKKERGVTQKSHQENGRGRGEAKPNFKKFRKNFVVRSADRHIIGRDDMTAAVAEEPEDRRTERLRREQAERAAEAAFDDDDDDIFGRSKKPAARARRR